MLESFNEKNFDIEAVRSLLMKRVKMMKLCCRGNELFPKKITFMEDNFGLGLGLSSKINVIDLASHEEDVVIAAKNHCLGYLACLSDIYEWRNNKVIDPITYGNMQHDIEVEFY